MEISKCFEILDIRPGASLEEIKAAYRDAVAVWHPDRFAGNPRLKEKADKKLKEINLAYETLMAYYENSPNPQPEQDSNSSNVEAVAELGTRIVLHACHYIMKKLKNI